MRASRRFSSRRPEVGDSYRDSLGLGEIMSILRIVGAVLGVVVVVFAVLVVRLFWIAGAFKTLEPHFDGTCENVPVPPGPEDLVVDRATRNVFLSSTDRRAMLAGGDARGDIYLLALGDLATAVPLTQGVPADFRPHGLSLYVAPDGAKTLMAINHPKAGGHVVEFYDMAETPRDDGTVGVALVHRRSVAGGAMRSPNDVAASGPGSFYITNDHGSTSALGFQLETYLALPRGNVVYFDGAEFSVVAEGFRYANGIALSPDGGHVYVAETTGHRLSSFARDGATGALDIAGTLDIETGLDNIDVDENGDLWIGAHPDSIAFLGHAGDAAKLSPSEVLKVKTENGIPVSAEQVYLDAGDEMSGSSVAVVVGGKMLVGDVFEPKILVCDLP